MRIATFNVNSIRARLPRFLEWLEEANPDVVALQETKVEDAKFPRAEIEALGYSVAIHGMQQRQGVAFVSKRPAENVVEGFMPDAPVDCRVIRAEFDGITVINTYVPNGNEVGSDKWFYKMAWLDEFPAFLSSFSRPSDPVIWLGDINIAPGDEDVHDHKRLLGSVGHHPDEFERLKKIEGWGLTETFRAHNPEPGHFTFWDYRVPNALQRNLGWRIDHIYVTEPLAGKVQKVWVDRESRAKEKASDHAPVVAQIEI